MEPSVKSSGEVIIIEGVADCAFVENGELVIVDFKTDRVKAENGEEEKYYINAQIQEDKEQNEIKQEEIQEKKEPFKLNKKTIVFISIGGALLIIVILIIVILNHINDKKISKKLDF